MPVAVDTVRTMRRVGRQNLNTPYETEVNAPLPAVPKGGARVKVHYAGMCYTKSQLDSSGRRRPKLDGINDGSLYAGYEVSGVVDAVCPTIRQNNNNTILPGARVIVYPERLDKEGDGFSDYVSVHNTDNLVRVPDGVDMKVACLLPCGGLTAYSAVSWLKPHILSLIEQRQSNCPVTILINGAGTLGLWTLSIARAILPSDTSKLRISMADNSIEKLETAKTYGCSGIVHWDNNIYEEYMIERTRSECRHGVDVVVDYSSTPRTICRAFKILSDGGILIVGGNSGFDCSIDIAEVASKEQTVKGVSRGRREQLDDLLQLVASQQVVAPKVHVFPVEEANDAFEQLNECSISARPVLAICPQD